MHHISLYCAIGLDKVMISLNWLIKVCCSQPRLLNFSKKIVELTYISSKISEVKNKISKSVAFDKATNQCELIPTVMIPFALAFLFANKS